MRILKIDRSRQNVNNLVSERERVLMALCESREKNAAIDILAALCYYICMKKSADCPDTAIGTAD